MKPAKNSLNKVINMTRIGNVTGKPVFTLSKDYSLQKK